MDARRTGAAGPPVTFRLLGAVAAWRGAEQIDLGPKRQRGVLCALLLRADQVVPAPDIVTAVWGENPPGDGPNVVSKYVGRLRRQLGAQTAPVWTGSGYRVPADAAVLDLLAFERHVARARAHRRDGDPESASRELHEALALWSGAALTGVDSPFLDAERDRLEELRLEAVEEHIEIDLELGRHRRWTSELTRLVAAHPLRERFTGQLMLALYRSGRQTDALNVFRSLRRTLAAELGIEPDPAIAGLHQAILRADPGLGAAEAGAQTRAPHLVPRQLPAVIGDFTGRTAEVDRLGGWMGAARPGGARARVMVVTGPGGVGKTSLALQVAHRRREDFPDGQLYVECAAGSRAVDLCARLLHALGVGGAAIPEPAERVALYRTMTVGKRLLLVFDNVETEDQVAPLIPADSRAAVVITARRELTALAADDRLELGMMPVGEAQSLLDEVIGADRLACEPGTSQQLVHLCGGLPLALRIAAARIAAHPHWTVGRLVRRLDDERRRLDELRHHDLAVRASLNLSYQVLAPQARRLLMRASLLDVPDLPEWGAAVLLDVDIAEAQDVLDQLLQARMLEVSLTDGPEAARYRFHDLVRLFARELAQEHLAPSDRDSVLDRALGAWLFLVEQADAKQPHGCYSRPAGPTARRPLDPGISAELLRDPLGWLDSERPALTALLLQAARTGRAAAAWELAAALLAYYEVRAHCTDWETTHLGALECVRAAGDRLGTAVILRGLAELHTLRDQIPEAIDCFTRARALFADLGKDHGVVDCDNGLGLMYRVSGRYEDALEVLTASAQAASRGGWPHSEAYARHGAGVVHLERGELAEAEACFRRALALAREWGYPRGAAQSERGLGLLSVQQNKWERAELHLERALAISTELGEPGAQATALQLLADLRMRRGDLDTVPELLHRALSIFEETGEPFGQALVLQTLGEHHHRTGDAGRAVATVTAAVNVWAGLKAPRWHARALVALGDVHAADGDRIAARRAWSQARELFARLGLAEGDTLAERLAGREPAGRTDKKYRPEVPATGTD